MLEKKHRPQEAEGKWQQFWQEQQIYNPEDNRTVFSIDTPPPTVSGSLHIGHVFSYTQAEMIARFQRMQDRHVFYSLGFDDNGLPTERLAENDHGIGAKELPREQFEQLCLDTTERYEAGYRSLFQAMGFSVDWSLTYKTVSRPVQRMSQRSFLKMAADGRAYRDETPVLWCPHCMTSIAQAELDSAERPSSFNWIAFPCGEKTLAIATTRPVLLSACAALFVHPDNQRRAHLIGRQAQVPLHGYSVPVLADGRIDKDAPCVGGMDIPQARRRMIAALQEQNLLMKQEEIVHTVGIHERCGGDIEITPSSQWYIDILSKKQQLLNAADKINWYPQSMKQRYRIWVENLKWDWCISRQRFFGVPFPVWYCRDCGKTLLANETQLPVNPLRARPRHACPCGSTDFQPESAVMDTWATSSLTPLVNARWQETDDRTQTVLPMSMRTQAHEIIRTWAFYTIVKTLYHTGITRAMCPGRTL